MGWIGWELCGASALIVNLGFPIRAGLVIVVWYSRWPVDSTESVLLPLDYGSIVCSERHHQVTGVGLTVQLCT